MQIRASLKPKVYEKWEKLLTLTGHQPQGLVTELVNQEWERRHGKDATGKRKGPGRPADSAIAKSAKQTVGWQIGVLQRMKDEGTKLPNFDRALEAMNALMEAGLWARALEYQKSNWWRQFAPPEQAIEPDWQSWLKEAESE